MSYGGRSVNIQKQSLKLLIDAGHDSFSERLNMMSEHNKTL